MQWLLLVCLPACLKMVWLSCELYRQLLRLCLW